MSKPMIPEHRPIKMLEAVLNNIKDFHEGNISETLFVMDMQYHYPNLVDALLYFSELESENEALKDDLKTLQGDYDDLEMNHDEIAYELTQAQYEFDNLYEEYQYAMNNHQEEE